MSIEKPDFFLFDGTFESFYEEIIDAVISKTPPNEKTLFWQARAHNIAKNITQDLLFEALTIAFSEKNNAKIERWGEDIGEENERNGFFDFSFKAMEKPNIHFEYVGDLGLFLCFEESTKELSSKTLNENPEVKKYLTKDEQKDLQDYTRCLELMNIKKADTICPLAAHLEKYCEPKNSPEKTKKSNEKQTPMQKKHPAYYPLLERRLLLAKIPEESKKNKLNQKRM